PESTGHSRQVASACPHRRYLTKPSGFPNIFGRRHRFVATSTSSTRDKYLLLPNMAYQHAWWHRSSPKKRIYTPLSEPSTPNIPPGAISRPQSNGTGV